MRYMMKKLFIFVFIFLGLNVVNGCPFFLSKYFVNIHSSIRNDNVTLRCQSKDDDLGSHVLSPNNDYEWSFCQSFSRATLFFCHFWWNNNEQIFDVFNSTMGEWCREGRPEGDICRWLVREDGFYFYEPIEYGRWLKQYYWKPVSKTSLTYG
ncbi:putative plant self-incompatibility S1 [Helianthus anomalus]